MRKVIVFITLISIFICAASFAQEYIISIGDKNYTAYDIRLVMEKNDCQVPDDAISIIAGNEVLQGLKKEKKNIYKNFFGKDPEIDAKYAATPEIIFKNKQAVSRLCLFDEWMTNKAKKVSVVYLDMEQFWELVKETESYRIREQAGRKLHYSSIPYTFAELQINDSQALALKDGKEYLSPAEYNDYVSQNYEDLIAQVKREKSITRAKNDLIKRITGEKLLAEITDINEAGLDDEMIEKQINKFVVDNMFDDDLNFVGEDYLSPVEMASALKSKYQTKHSKKLMNIKKALQGKYDLKNESFAIKNHIQKAKLQGLKSRMMQKLEKDKVYTWMQQSNFPGSIKEATFVLANEEYAQKQEDALKQNNIIFNFVD